jgi:hypothetical protein
MVAAAWIAIGTTAPAFAQPAKATATKTRVVRLRTLIIVGKPQRPMAAVEIARVRPVLATAPTGQQLLSRIDTDAAKLAF